MHFWSSIPFFRYLIWLLAGILSAFAWPGLGGFGFMVPILVLVYILSYFLRRQLAAYRLWQGLLACLIVFLLGYGRVGEQGLAFPDEQFLSERNYWLLEALHDAVPTAKSYKLQARLLALNREGIWEPQQGELMLYIRQEGMHSLPRYGQRLIVYAQPRPVPEPLNPGEFNYRDYLAGQGICCQAFVKADQVVMLPAGESASLGGLAMQIRRWASGQVQHYMKGRQEAAIVNALVLGHRETLDQEIRQAYATAGAMHILAVSGLHVGFIYLFIKLLLRRWRRYPWLSYAGFVLTLLLLWSYAFITGLSPSVLRAVWMFSLLDLALLIRRKTGIYNTLAIAAFFMLLYNPNMLHMVGFQLSFLSLLGIVYLQPRLAGWYKGDHRLLLWAWKLIAVSIAAQLATFPLGLYYFGQFPTYFFISNLLIVPVAGFILGLGILVLASSLFFEPLAVGAGLLLDWLVWLVNRLVFFTESLPYSRLTGHISQGQVLLLFLFIGGLLLLLQYKRFAFAVMTSLIGIFLAGSLLYGEYRHRAQQKLVLYHIPGYSALQLVDGKGDYLLADAGLPADMINYRIQPNRAGMGFAEFEQEQIFFKPAIEERKGYTLLVWQGLRIVQVKTLPTAPCEPGTVREQGSVPTFDYAIISHNSVQSINQLLCYFRPKKLLIDGSNKAWLQRKLRQEAEGMGIPVHVTAEAGAFVEEY